MDTLRSFIENYTPLNEPDWQIISNAFKPNYFDSNQTLLREGAICRYFYFLEKGLVRFSINKDGNDITKFFTLAPFCFTSKESFRYQKPAVESIETITGCRIRQMNWNDANELLRLPSWTTFTRMFVHHVQQYTEELLMENKTETAELRYQKLVDKYPDIINEIPLKHLASYLGIAPQSLSRIRKKIK